MTYRPALYIPGEQLRFTWRVHKGPHGWALTDHDGYERHLGETWQEAVPRFHLIAENHAMTGSLS